MIKYDKKETRANRHKRKVTLRFPVLRQVVFRITQKSADGHYLPPVITMDPSVFSMQSQDELNEFKVALTRSHEIWQEMSRYAGQKSRTFMGSLLS